MKRFTGIFHWSQTSYLGRVITIWYLTPVLSQKLNIRNIYLSSCFLLDILTRKILILQMSILVLLQLLICLFLCNYVRGDNLFWGKNTLISMLCKCFESHVDMFLKIFLGMYVRYVLNWNIALLKVVKHYSIYKVCTVNIFYKCSYMLWIQLLKKGKWFHFTSIIMTYLPNIGQKKLHSLRIS